MYIIGLTGGIASGKSLVAQILKQLGAEVINGDVIGHEIIEPGLPAYSEVVDEFGPEILDSDGKIDRKKLGEIVFLCPKKLQILNHITHPRILSRIREIIDSFREQHYPHLLVVEAALLYESNLNFFVDEVWTVEAEKEIQVKRLKERNHLSEEQALRRINSQMPARDRIARSDLVIYNNGEADILFRQIMEIWRTRFN